MNFRFCSPRCVPLVGVFFALLWGLARAQSESFLPDSGYSEDVENGLLSAQETIAPEGWQGAWDLPKSGASPAFQFRTSANLAPSGGGGVLIVPADEAVQEIGRKLAQTIPMKGNAAIYASFRLSLSEKKAQGSAYVLFSGIGGLGAGVSEGYLMVLVREIAGLPQDSQAARDWIPLPLLEYQANTPYFFVVKILAGEDAWAAADEIEVWINPKQGSGEEAASSQALVHNRDTAGNVAPPSGGITQVMLHAENLPGVAVKFDDLRVGTTWESVTGPVPP